MKKKNKVGRPLMYKTAEELQAKVEEYFDSTDRITFAGLAYHLGLSREALYNYEERDQFVDVVKRARDRVKAVFEERAIYEPNPTGVIFVMKNLGYSDNIKTENTNEHKVEVKPPIAWIKPKRNEATE